MLKGTHSLGHALHTVPCRVVARDHRGPQPAPALQDVVANRRASKAILDAQARVPGMLGCTAEGMGYSGTVFTIRALVWP